MDLLQLLHVKFKKNFKFKKCEIDNCGDCNNEKKNEKEESHIDDTKMRF